MFLHIILIYPVDKGFKVSFCFFNGSGNVVTVFVGNYALYPAAFNAASEVRSGIIAELCAYRGAVFFLNQPGIVAFKQCCQRQAVINKPVIYAEIFNVERPHFPVQRCVSISICFSSSVSGSGSSITAVFSKTCSTVDMPERIACTPYWSAAKRSAHAAGVMPGRLACICSNSALGG